MSDLPVLRLTLRNVDSLENGQPTTLLLAQRNAIIGRSPTADWCLPDPQAYVSSRHCEISYAMGEYRLADRSTNGTFLKGSAERMPGPHILCDGDSFQVGQYEIAVALEGGARPADEAPAAPQWTGWAAPEPAAPDMAVPSGWGATDAPVVAPPATPWTPAPGADAAQPAAWMPSPAPVAAPGGWEPAPAAPARWDVAPAAPAPAPSGWHSAPVGGTPAAPSGSPWDVAPSPPRPPASAWSSDGAAAAQPAAEDAWGKLASSYAVDWSRGGFDAAAPAAAPVAPADQGAFAPPSVHAPRPAPSAAAPSAPVAAPTDAAMARMLAAAGLDRGQVKQGEAETMDAAGNLLRRLVSGLVVMMEARARAKSQMGAQTTIFSRERNNPIKFALSPEAALAQLLNPPLSGYMPADRAVEDSFRDLQLHQIATLKAMQGALRATLARFSPDSIRKRASAKGMLQRILPGARDAALWEAYEREFSGVAQGSDEAFMDVFAKEFRKAYDEAAATM